MEEFVKSVDAHRQIGTDIVRRCYDAAIASINVKYEGKSPIILSSGELDECKYKLTANIRHEATGDDDTCLLEISAPDSTHFDIDIIYDTLAELTGLKDKDNSEYTSDESGEEPKRIWWNIEFPLKTIRNQILSHTSE